LVSGADAHLMLDAHHAWRHFVDSLSRFLYNAHAFKLLFCTRYERFDSVYLKSNQLSQFDRT
jgi:hypothetical protein